MHTNTIDIILWQSLVIFLLLSSLTGVVLGLLLIFKPHLMDSVNRVANRWVSTRRMIKPADRVIDAEGWFFKYHRPVGIMIMLGAGYILVAFGLTFDKAAALRRLSIYVPMNMLDILVDGMVLFALIGAVVALLFGLFMCLRPSLLRGAEEISDQWFSLRRVTKRFCIPHDHIEVYVARHRQRVGWSMLMGSIYLSFVTFRWLAWQA